MNKLKAFPWDPPLFPIVANIFMEHFETLTVNSYPHKPKCWFQVVDDNFIIWP
jgi:hypothetical protein